MKISFNSRFLILLGIVGLLLVGCSEKPQPSDAPEASVGSTRPLVLYSWGDYFSEDALATFTERTGVKVDYQTFENADMMVESLKSKPEDYDVLVVDDVMVKWLRSQKLARRLERTELAHFSHIGDRFVGKHYDSENEYSIPYMWGTTLLAYRADKVEEPKESWQLLFDPTVKGKLMLLEERTDCYPALLISLGYSANSDKLEEIEEATELLVRLVKEQGATFGSDMEIKDALLTGECWVALAYSGDAASAAEENSEIAFFIPEEGAPRWIDSFMISRDSPQSANAHRFIDFMCEPEIAAMSSNYLWYATPNTDALQFLDEELASDTTIYPSKEILDRCQDLLEANPKVERAMNIGWRKAMQAADFVVTKE